MDVPNRQLLLELVIALLSAGNGGLGLRTGGLFVNGVVWKQERPLMYGAGLASSFETAALLGLHVALVLWMRVSS